MIEFAMAAGFLGLLAIPVILLIFSLRPQRRTVVVSSNALWQAAVRDQRQGLGLRKLLGSFSLLLCLLAGLAVALSLAEPQSSTSSNEPGDLIVVVDTSASMKVRDNGKSRFELGIERARELVTRLPIDQRALIITSDRRAVLRSGFESQAHRLNQVLDGLAPTDSAGQPQLAVDLALSLLQSRDQGRIVFITDGAFDGAVDAVGAHFRTLLVPAQHAPPNNFAITRFDVRPRFNSPGSFQALVEIRSFAAAVQAVPMELAIEGRALLEETLNLEPGETTSRYLDFRGPSRGRAVVRLVVEDGLAADNAAQVTYGGHGPINVLLVSPGNVFLDSLFAAMPRLLVERRKKIAPGELVLLARRHDLVVLDRHTVESLPDEGRFLIFGSPPEGLPFADSGELEDVRVSGTGNAAFIEGLDFSSVKVERARRLIIDPAAAGLQRLLWSRQGDLALAVLRGGRRVVYFGFHLGQSNLPAQALFPLLLTSAMDWLVPRRVLAKRTQLQAGDAIELDVPGGDAEILLRLPSAEALVLSASEAKVVFDQTDEVGLYRYTVYDVVRYFAVNLASAPESDIRRRAGFSDTNTSASTVSATAQTRVVRPLWAWLVFAALALLVGESLLWRWRRGA